MRIRRERNLNRVAPKQSVSSTLAIAIALWLSSNLQAHLSKPSSNTQTATSAPATSTTSSADNCHNNLKRNMGVILLKAQNNSKEWWMRPKRCGRSWLWMQSPKSLSINSWTAKTSNQNSPAKLSKRPSKKSSWNNLKTFWKIVKCKWLA